VRAWRFGSDGLPAGGLGTREELLAAYRAAGGAAVDAAGLRFWEVYGTLRWGVMCGIQASVHLSGAVRSVELAAIGRRACEMEWALLELIG
jgi:aminoglycoside phosphotransferase (APT) family kinase protein